MDEKIAQKYARAPHKPGVYIFKSNSGKALYIGKARDIKKRLASYIHGKNLQPRIEAMLRRAADLEWIITDNELEALILEATLIRREKPRYNSELKDDKRYPYIKITKETFPRVLVVRRKEDDGAIYFGPYADRTGAVRLMRTIRRLFRIRPCNYELPSKRRIKPCILKDIGRCLAPCDGSCTPEEYNEAVEEMVMFLRGKRRELVEQLRTKMEEAAKNLAFEKAASYRDTIAELEKMLVPQKMDTDVGDRDFVAVAVGSGIGVGVIFRVRQGVMISRHTLPMQVPRQETIPEVLAELISSFYADDPDIPPEIFVQEKPESAEELEQFLSTKRGKRVHIKVPERGTKYQTIALARRNAELLHTELLLQKKKRAVSYAVSELEQLLKLPRTPLVIEAFDISNFGAKTVVASMVRFHNGKPAKSEYRHYRIKTVEGQDDFASMREVVYRRYRRLLDEQRLLPDLILIDGGKGQLSAAQESLAQLGLWGKIPVIALAKRLDEVYIPGNPDPISLPKNSSALRLIQRVRDEAHRFAITYSRRVHQRKNLALLLTQVEGIGPARAETLLKTFGSVEEILGHSAEQIREKTRIPLATAERLLEFLREHEKTAEDKE